MSARRSARPRSRPLKVVFWFNFVLLLALGGWYVAQPAARQEEVRMLVENYLARNKRIDLLRREKFIEAAIDDEGLENTLVADSAEPYADAQTVEQLNTALESLPEEQAKLLRMAFFEDKSHSVISDETQLPLGTVKSRLRLAMDKLRQKMSAGTQQKQGDRT